MSHAMVVMLMLAAAPPVFADQSLPAPRAGARFGVLRPTQPADPYGKLFAPQRDLKTADAAPNAATQPWIVCGMTLIPGDPGIDPKFFVGPKADGLDYTLRKVPPPICRPSR